MDDMFQLCYFHAHMDSNFKDPALIFLATIRIILEHPTAESAGWLFIKAIGGFRGGAEGAATPPFFFVHF